MQTFFSKKSINFSAIESLDFSDVINSNVNDHWKKNLKKIQKIFTKHVKLFKFNLKKFNNDIKMSIFFKNEVDIQNFKQISYSISAKNRRILNEILNSLIKKKTNSTNFVENNFFDFIINVHRVKKWKI